MPPATRGPIPKRREELLGHRSKAELDEPDKVRMVGVVRPPAVPKRADGTPIHQVAARWYRSLRRSGQSNFYDPSDWALAVFVAHQMDMVLMLGPLGWSPQALKVIMDASEKLLVTEAARRRARIEIERVPAMGDTGEKPKEIRDHRSRITTTT